MYPEKPGQEGYIAQKYHTCITQIYITEVSCYSLIKRY